MKGPRTGISCSEKETYGNQGMIEKTKSRPAPFRKRIYARRPECPPFSLEFAYHGPLWLGVSLWVSMVAEFMVGIPPSGFPSLEIILADALPLRPSPPDFPGWPISPFVPKPSLAQSHRLRRVIVCAEENRERRKKRRKEGIQKKEKREK